MGHKKLMQEWRMAFVININVTRHSVDMDGDMLLL